MKVFKKDKKNDQKLIEIEKKAEEYLSGWRRCLADFENYKKGQEDWLKKFKNEALEDIFNDLIPVLNNFSLALNHIPENEENRSLIVGIQHIEKQLKDVLTGKGLQLIEVKKGDVFDPNFHECVEKETEEKEGSVLLVDEIISSGYKLGDKVLAPAKVKIRTKI